MRCMDISHPLQRAIAIVGLGPMAKAMGITYPAIRKWQRAGRMPRTEWTGETRYAAQISAMTGQRVSVAELLGPWPQHTIPKRVRHARAEAHQPA